MIGAVLTLLACLTLALVINTLTRPDMLLGIIVAGLLNGLVMLWLIA